MNEVTSYCVTSERILPGVGSGVNGLFGSRCGVTGLAGSCCGVIGVLGSGCSVMGLASPAKCPDASKERGTINDVTSYCVPLLCMRPPREDGVAGLDRALSPGLGGCSVTLCGKSSVRPRVGDTPSYIGDAAQGAGDMLLRAGETLPGAGDTPPGKGDRPPGIGDTAADAGGAGKTLSENSDCPDAAVIFPLISLELVPRDGVILTTVDARSLGGTLGMGSTVPLSGGVYRDIVAADERGENSLSAAMLLSSSLC